MVLIFFVLQNRNPFKAGFDYIITDLMRIALVTIIEPRPGSGNGITEYSYRPLQELKKITKNTPSVLELFLEENALCDWKRLSDS